MLERPVRSPLRATFPSRIDLKSGSIVTESCFILSHFRPDFRAPNPGAKRSNAVTAATSWRYVRRSSTAAALVRRTVRHLTQGMAEKTGCWVTHGGGWVAVTFPAASTECAGRERADKPRFFSGGERTFWVRCASTQTFPMLSHRARRIAALRGPRGFGAIWRRHPLSGECTRHCRR